MGTYLLKQIKTDKFKFYSVKIENQFLEIITLIKNSRNNALRLINTELINLYNQIGAYISKRIETEEWGRSVVERLSKHIERNEPELKGFSSQNLWRMKQFYEAYKDYPKLSPLVREVSWSNNLLILTCKDIEEKQFYLNLSIQEKYTKRELERQINSSFYERTILEKKISPVGREIKQPLASTFKDRYVFEFLHLPASFSEMDLQKALLKQMKTFILELGKDFLFIDEEYRVQVGNTDFEIDLLFYHRELQCLVAFELKTDKFKPEYLGQLNFYLEALDRDVRKKHENPSIGILLCKDQDEEVVKYSLGRSLSPAMVSAYQMQLPEKKLLKEKLHSIFENDHL